MIENNTLSIEAFNHWLTAFTEDLSERDEAAFEPFVRVFLEEDESYTYCDFELNLKRSTEADYVNYLFSLGQFLANKGMPVAAVFVAGSGTYRPTDEDRFEYPAILVSGESCNGWQGTAHALVAADGTLNSFSLYPASPDTSGFKGQVANCVFQGIKRRSSAMDRLIEQRN